MYPHPHTNNNVWLFWGLCDGCVWGGGGCGWLGWGGFAGVAGFDPPHLVAGGYSVPPLVCLVG